MNPIESQQDRINLIQSVFKQIVVNANLPDLNLRLPAYVYLLGDLPPHPPIVLATEVESQIWLMARQKFQSASLWLRTFLLGEALQPEAYELPTLYYETLADFLSAYFHLTVAVHSRTICPEVLAFPSPADLWFYSCVSMSIEQLALRGLTDVPSLKGKRESTNQCLKVVSALRNLSFEPDYIPSICSDPVTHVVLKAQEIANTDRSFYREHLLPYLRVVRRSLKKDNECKHVQLVYRLPNGKMFKTGKDKKLPVNKRL